MVEVVFHLVVLWQAQEVAVLHVHQVLWLWGGGQWNAVRPGAAVTKQASVLSEASSLSVYSPTPTPAGLGGPVTVCLYTGLATAAGQKLSFPGMNVGARGAPRHYSTEPRHPAKSGFSAPTSPSVRSSPTDSVAFTSPRQALGPGLAGPRGSMRTRPLGPHPRGADSFHPVPSPSHCGCS